MKTADTKRTTEPLRYDLTNDEIAAIARERETVLIEGERLEQNFESLKAEHKFKKTDIENRLAKLSQKVRDGFEMRPTELEVSFNDPVKGRKTIRVLNGENAGAVIREEAMTHLDTEQYPLPGMEPESPAENPVPGLTVLEGDGETQPNGIEPHPNLTENGERTGTLSQTEGGENAGEVSVGDVLVKAAVEAQEPPVPLDLAKFGSDYKKAWKAFKKAAEKLGWKPTSIAILDEQICNISNREVVEQKDFSESAFAVLQAHVTAETK